MMRRAGRLLVVGLCIACGSPTESEPALGAVPGGGMSGGTTSNGGNSAVIGGSGAPAGGQAVMGAGGAAGASSSGAGQAGNDSATAGQAGMGGSAGGALGTGGAAGEAAVGGGGSSADVDQTPWRPLNVTAAPDDYSFVFQASDADPEALQQNGNQIGRIDTRVTPLGKLVVDMGSSGGSNMAWFPQRGFHFMAVDFMGVNEVPDVVGRSPEFYGDVRLEALTGEDRVPDIDVNFHDSFEGHVTYGLAYLHASVPDQDWGYYLNEDGSVRWSDVIVTGRSHGASSTPRFAKVRRLWRAVSRAGPRDNTCGEDPACSEGIVATWFSEESKTPIDRYFSISGMADAQFPEIQYALEALGYLGEPVNVEQVAPPYDGSHRLTSSAGHMGFCNEGAEWDDACNYMFGVPPENQ